MKELGISTHRTKGDAEIIDLKNIRGHTGSNIYIDADLVKDITTHRSVTSVVHKYNKVSYA